MTDSNPALSPVKQALLTINRQQARIRELEQAAHEPIAIIGLGCRFPGGADDPEAFWQLLAEGREAIAEVPPERWNIEAYYDPNPDSPGKMNSRHGGFCRDVTGFDAEFFNLSPRELRAMDPQQRMLLEVAWEALENANLIPGELYGSRSGVYVGISTLDYYARQQAERDAGGIGAYYVSGGVLSVAAGRLSYLLGLNGPSLSVDTACSSSLTALHLACQGLRRRECDLALSGGVGLLLTPEPSIAFSKARMLAPDGRCKTFDASADGYVRGEGCGVLVLKRLADAIADGERILAVVRGTATNQNGASGGLTVPSGAAQEAVIREALADAGLSPEQVDYVEAHGTGTSLGDPIELRALGQVFGGASKRGRPLWVGSVKTNFGHLEAAAGVAGVIKSVLALQHGAIPPHLNFSQPTPHFDWHDFPLQVPTGLQPWPAGPDDGRIAGISSFGFAGSNAHVLIGPAPAANAFADTAEAQSAPAVLLLSAHCPASLRELAGRYAELLRRQPQIDLAALCHNAARYRSRYPQRLALAATSVAELATQLEAYQAGQKPPAMPASHPAAEAVAAFLAGEAVAWQAIAARPYPKIALPTTPFQRQPYWFDQESPTPSGHPLLGRRLASPFMALLYETELREGQPAFLTEHRVGGEIVVAAAHYLAMMLAALDRDGRQLQDLQFPRALALPAGGSARLQLGIGHDEAGRAQLKIAAQDGAAPADAPWTLHAGAVVAPPAAYAVQEDLASVQARCGTAADPELLYRHAGAGGIQLGDSFRPIRSLRRGEGEALAQLAGSFGPGLLDGCFQTSLATLAELPAQTLVPFNIAKVVCLRQPNGPTLWCQAKLKAQDENRLQCDLRLWDTDGRLCLSLEGFEARAADPTALAGRAGAAWRDWLYRIEWRPQPAFGRSPLPNPTTLGLSIAKNLPNWVDAQAVDGYGLGLAALERLSAAYAREACRQLAEAGIHSETGVVEPHRRLYRRLQQIDRASGGETDLDSARLAAELAQDHPAVAGELRVLQRCGAALAQVLRGQCDPLQLLFPGGDSGELAALYADSAAAHCMNTLLAETAAQALQDWPADKPVRILEIGAGTGASSAYLLRKLGGRRLQYTFSDITPHFLAKAKQRFTERDDIEYRVLDIERDPLQQGFSADSFDLVVAANVLHATQFMADTAAHCRQLLAPAGLLLLLEGVAPQRWLDLIFGLTDGWWRFKDTDLRPEHPLLSPAAWQALLQRSGFSDCIALSPDQRDGAVPLHQAVLVAAKAETAGSTAAQRTALIGQRWLILADRSGCGEALAERLQADGAECHLAVVGRPHANGQALAADDRSAFEQYVKELTVDAPLQQVLYLSALDAERDTENAGDPQAAVTLSCQGALHLLQALLAAGQTPSLTLAVAGNPTSAGSLLPGHAPLWGLGKVIALEHPELQCRRLDVGAARGAQAAALLYPALFDRDEAELALRDGTVYAPRLARYLPSGKAEAAITEDGAYLITGAFGGLGLLLAEWLVDRGAGELVLLGRSTPDAACRAKLEAWQAQGVKITVHALDVCDLPALQAAVAGCRLPLRGVFHAAGVLDDALLLDQDWPRLAWAMAPKVQGAWNLHLATAGCPLDYFVLYSSAAALLGSAGQASHAAGNAFLDALALNRRAAGLPGLSIAWGAWAEIGAAARVQHGAQQTLARWQRQGFATLAPQQAMQAFQALLADAEAGHVGVLPIEWPSLLRDRPNDPCLAEFRRNTPKVAAETELKPSSGDVLANLQRAPAGQHSGLLLAHARGQVAQILGWNNAEAVDPKRSFLELGLDSLTSMELRNRLQTTLACSLPTTLTFDYPNLALLAEFLATQVVPGATNEPSAATPGPDIGNPADALARLEQMSDEELDPLLIALLTEAPDQHG